MSNARSYSNGKAAGKTILRLALLTGMAFTFVTTASAQSTSDDAVPRAPVSSDPQSAITIGTFLGHTTSEIAQSLEAAGYTIRELEDEHGRIEVKLRGDTRLRELKIDATSGRVTKIEGGDHD